MNDVTPPALNSRKVTRELTTRLCSKDHVLHGINEIMKFENSEDCELQHHGRKVLSLLSNIFYNQLTISVQIISLTEVNISLIVASTSNNSVGDLGCAQHSSTLKSGIVPVHRLFTSSSAF
jgi:hypothetical protein